MLQLGLMQELKMTRRVDFGVYLGENADSQEEVLLPRKQVPEGLQPGDSLRVFLYRDSEDRMIATTKTPLLMIGQVAKLNVRELNRYGAFLDWGLEKDLFLPFKQQTYRPQQGEQCLVTMYVDKSGRLCATMKIYAFLEQVSGYQKDDRVEGLVYEISDNFGAFVAVDEKYSALIPKRELYGQVEAGQHIRARVASVLEDGRLVLSIREKAYLQMEKDAEAVLALIDSFDGALPFTDKANPEVIRRETGMSKNEFKRAVGSLLKAGKIRLTEKSIRRI